MILSIVTGTWNRLRYLQRMLTSARSRIPRGIDYEFVIVDGGSTDGTLEWLRSQPDVHLIEHGALLGAVRAFTEGGEAAQGEYVLLANDDIEFTGNGIVEALVYLEQHSFCGAVAFADDRPSPGYGEGYKVQHIQGITPEGTPIRLVYAQVGLFRRDAAQDAGWWGWHDTVMQQARTYGGDCFLSARLWEAGWTVDAVDGVQVNDLIVPDSLRAMNTEDALKKPSQYYLRYPNGVKLPMSMQRTTISERLRVLYLPIYEPMMSIQRATKRGLREALAKQFRVFEYDYCNDKTFDLVQTVRDIQPHLLLMQVHGTDLIHTEVLKAARAERPEMVVVNWNGDVYEQNLTSPEMLDLLRYVDLQLVVNANVLERYTLEGIDAAYWQVGFEPISSPLPTVHHHDIVFLANAYSAERVGLGRTLKRLPYDVGLYGYGWGADGDGFTLYDFSVGAALYRNAKVAIGDNQYPDKVGFVSNRVFEALANGAFLLHQSVEGLETLTGLEEGVHYIAWKNVDDLKRKLKYWLAPPQDARRQAIRTAGEAFVRENHSFNERVRELFEELLPKVSQRDTV